MLEKILVCLDGSKTAEKVLDHITDDALKSQSKIVLLRVTGLPEVTVPLAAPGVPGIPMSSEAVRKASQEREEEAGEYLKAMAEKLTAKGLSVEYAVIPGMSGETIIEYAKSNDCSLIAIGTHGHGFARRLFLGSTADYVIRHTDIPVLVIRPKD